MTFLRLALLSAALALCTAASHAVVQTQASATLPGVADAQLDPTFWVARLDTPDAIILAPDAIAALNRKIARLDPSMYDIRHLPATLPRNQVLAWVNKASPMPTRPLYTDNGLRIDQSALNTVMNHAGIDTIPESTTPRYGMAVTRTSLRSYPTGMRAFSQPGDTDIDRFQESALYPGDPVAIVHTTRDGRWFFVVSERYAAWVAASDIAQGSAKQVFAQVDATPFRVITGAKPRTVYTPESVAVSERQLDMGTRVPLATQTGVVNGQNASTSYVLRLPVRTTDGHLAFQPALLQRNGESSAGYLPLTQANIIRQAFRFLGERYGWGNAYNGRDCSGFVADVYRSMGVVLPRNTGDQSTSPGLDHQAFTDADGHDARASAVESLQPGDLIYIPGHVMMMIGRIDGQPYVIHDVTGINVRNKQGALIRTVINEVAVTPLLPLMYDEKHSFVDRMTSIVRIRP
ncbi:cell wall-associated NlpC family hydrolase [Luteibacter sp. Sphag1AF]|uniref:C40 family peptidase n=1 Tax=Luteibacter sp. Sphag1AF TaxID=2587031 RepID=UPI001838178C|nr:SH3 domain-containing protein [Luteibacter sp. Sphag1AF]MBB3227590.1 cell wall-associated NlpC family hydrolase [Luteibacter sp. Sphag1AF]